MPIHTTPHLWILETNNTAYALGLNQQEMLVHTYWGNKLPRAEDYPLPAESIGWASFSGAGDVLCEEYPAHGGNKYIEPAIQTTFSDGVRDLVFGFVNSTVLEDELQIQLRDVHYPFSLTLHYRIHANYDLIERFVTAENHGTDPVLLPRIFSAQWHTPAHRQYRLSHLAGAWFKETQLLREPLEIGTKVLESRRMTSSHQNNPFFALDTLQNPASEHSGEVWFALLAWSGNWKMTAEQTIYGTTRVNLGINDWDFALRLEAGKSYTTPGAIGGYSSQGFGQMSRNLHNYTRHEVLPHKHSIRKVLYNSWEATAFDVNEHSQIELAKIAADLGVELFVLDDGWFHKRNSDHAALGDWWADQKKFPNGLNPLIEQVNALGMDFGLWLEPEMVSPDSELYRQHPDWAIHFPTRERTTARNQLMLNLARVEVQDYLIGLLDKLLSEHNIAFIKWDMNRNVSEPGWQNAPEPKEIWVRYVEGVYRVWGTLRQRHPKVIWQSCSGGGGRADVGIMHFADQVWISDMTEPTMRLQIQEGYSQAYPANTMEAWVTDMGAKHLPLEFRFHVSMAGVLGIGANLHRWSTAEREQAKRLIADYKALRHIIQNGDLYRLEGCPKSHFSSLMYVSRDKSEAVFFAWRTHAPDPIRLPPVHLFGLEPERLYRINGTVRSGAAWQNIGLEVALGDFSSVLWHISAQN
ncbi:MAG: alpha-galactosidase [Deinococcales bacterium]